jgi:hypothetical protein
MTDDTYQTRIFFGWWVVLVTGIVSGLSMRFYVYGISALFKPIALELGLTRAATSGAAGIGIMAGGSLSSAGRPDSRYLRTATAHPGWPVPFYCRFNLNEFCQFRLGILSGVGGYDGCRR